MIKNFLMFYGIISLLFTFYILVKKYRRRTQKKQEPDLDAWYQSVNPPSYNWQKLDQQDYEPPTTGITIVKTWDNDTANKKRKFF